MHSLHVFTPAITLILVSAILLENLLYLKLKKPFDQREVLTSFLVLALGKPIHVLLQGILLSKIDFLKGLSLEIFSNTNDLKSWLMSFLLVEFFYYWHHRLGHQISWFWASHQVHHSISQLNFGNSLRLSWTAILSGQGIVYLPLIFMGLSIERITFLLEVNFFYQFWLHTELVSKLGILEWVINTPSQHRVHHGVNPLYQNKNFGGVLCIFDRLFRTYQSETEPSLYPSTDKEKCYNPFKVSIQGWIQFFKGVDDTSGEKPN